MTTTLFFSGSTRGFYSREMHAASEIPSDAVEISPALHAEMMAAQSRGKIIVAGDGGQPFAADPAPRTLAQVQSALAGTVQRHLDAQAQALGYDDLKTAATYADEPAVPKYQAEGRALRAWRSNVWHSAGQVMDAVIAGTAPVPTAAGLIAQLPVFVAP